MKYSLNGKNIVLTGASGTVGEGILEKLSSGYAPNQIICIDNNESGLFFTEQKYRRVANTKFFLCDIREYQDLKLHFSDADVVIHAAALKHVVMCEKSPEQAVATNILGTQNVVRCASEAGVERVLVTSSDKAVNPTNVMGTSKLMAERIVTAANASSRHTKFSCTRFGNVLGSNGSVIPIFKKQIQDRKEVTVTDKDMTRFVMTLPEATDLVLESCETMLGGEVFVTKMPVMKIDVLADAMLQLLADKKFHSLKSYIGVKPGEKLYEELMTQEEMGRAIELEKFFVILPAYSGFYNHIDYVYENLVSERLLNPYNSSVEPSMSLNQTKKYLVSKNIIDITPSPYDTRIWPGDEN